MSVRARQRGSERKLVKRLKDIPKTFASREEEAEWWDSHDITADLLESGPEVRAELFDLLGVKDPKTNQK
jgi:hypothetical protein